MIQMQNILVPLDFSDTSDSALMYARVLARTFGARLHVMHVVDEGWMVASADGFTNEISSVMADLLDTAEIRMMVYLNQEDWQEPRTITEVRAGYPAQEIVTYANDIAADLIVMGAHGRGFLSRLLVGKVADKVVRTAPCPVLTVKNPEHDFVQPDLRRLNNIGSILVATDFGPACESALAYGRSMARTFNARLHVLHVTPNALMHSGPESIGVNLVEAQATIDADGTRRLEAFVGEDDRRELGAIAVVRSGRTPADEVAAYATAHGIDLIIAGTHGRGPVAHFFMGSVAERIVRMAPCPVLTVRRPEHEFVHPDALEVVARTGRA